MPRGSASTTTVVTGLREALPVTTSATTSRALVDNERVRIVVFAFDAGEQLTEHTASMPAVLTLVDGAMRLDLDEGSYELGPGDCAYLPAHAPHSLEAHAPSRLHLALLRAA